MESNEATYKNLVHEYFTACRWSVEQWNDYRKRLKTFFDDETNHADYYEHFLDSGIGESYYMAFGVQIIRDFEE